MEQSSTQVSQVCLPDVFQRAMALTSEQLTAHSSLPLEQPRLTPEKPSMILRARASKSSLGMLRMLYLLLDLV